ncbi:hypothetical protein K490DRAFT_66722 [Saccharata proteae CBS 121410]|uniref:Transcription factor Iwr1 domain-containing protein n=1 Tax=Saccharata proteae CBS 121410 TaxID=1314787 RepID=A0A9P4HRB8_9PEZI|nr:hypothetical protein K490DRAFT_66722 [Saccharata proteae CBS 121410]
MSQLPQTVRIKRKAQDEPVESLVVQTQHDRRKRRVTEPASFFRRVKDTPEASTGPSAPSISEDSIQQPGSSRPVERKSSQPSTPRRFHLSKPSVSASPLERKRRNVATLVESRSKIPRTKDVANEHPTPVPGATVTPEDDDSDAMQIDPSSSPPLKRPGKASRLDVNKNRDKQPHDDISASVSTTEPTGATRSTKDPSQVPSSDENAAAPSSSSTADADLLLQMQKFAEQVEEQEVHERQPPTQPHRSPQPLKFQPKVPAQRYRERHPHHPWDIPPGDLNTSMEIDEGDESDIDYVYDTYIRCDEPATLRDPTSQLDGNIGVLVLTDEDQALWESYLVDSDESDKDWNSEEEDENAEDFYGNEYPEEEVASDDEIGEGAYNYRAGASDDEEYGLSDEGEDMKRPWGRYPWLSGRKHYAAEENNDGEASD